MSKKKEPLNLFDCIPCIKEKFTSNRVGDLIVVSYPRFRNSFLQRMLTPASKSRDLHIRLDANGTAVWELIDGKRTVREISDSLADYFAHKEDYPLLVAGFVRTLEAQGLITCQPGTTSSKQ